jgi:hypothetical protein
MDAATSGPHRSSSRRCAAFPWSVAVGVLLPACLSPFEARHETSSDSRDQIWMSEASQVALRAAQSRVFDTTDRIRILSAVVATLQDLGFMIEVLDEDLGIVSAKRFDPNEMEAWPDPTYHTYDDDTPLLFSKTYMTWGPFFHRANLVRTTVTVRRRGDTQSVVRANAQFYMRAVEDPEPYRRFFQALEQMLLMEGRSLSEDAASS